MEAHGDAGVRTPAPQPDELLALLRRHRAAESELRVYVMGLLDGLGIPRERFDGIDDVSGDLLLHDPPGEPDDE